jgi:integrase
MAENMDVETIMPLSLAKTTVARRKRQPRRGGQKQAFSREAVSLVRATLKASGDMRGLALLNVSLDTMLRSCDLVRLTVRDVTDERGEIVEQFEMRQRKTGRSVTCELSPRSRDALAVLIRGQQKVADDPLFTARGRDHGPALTTQMLRIVVKAWARLAHLDAAGFSCHSLRRTNATVIYAGTNDIVSVARLLGHSSTAHTAAYLSVGSTEALAIARQFRV